MLINFYGVARVYYSNELVHISDYVYMIEQLYAMQVYSTYCIFYYSSSLKDWSYLQRRVSGSMLNSLRGSGRR